MTGAAHASKVPRATYRVQLHAGFTLDDAAGIVPYLAELGISHLYTSPVLQAAPGSTHGYDVVDHGQVSTELGGMDAFERLVVVLHAHGMGLVIDIVPNHMSIGGAENRWWWDVLERGRESRFAPFFDVDWEAGAIVLPVLPDEFSRVLDVGGIRLTLDGDRILVAHADRRFPIDPRTAEPMLVDRVDRQVATINADPERLKALLEQQHYRLASWRASLTELRYRRFFDVNELIGLRQEDGAVFDETHRLVLGWVERGLVDGLRVDHPDGLRDPAGYLARLRAAAPDAWIVTEKILAPDEELPGGWPVDGTTGYGFANLATGLFIDPAGEAGLTATWAATAGVGPDWQPMATEARLEVLSSLLGSDVNRLVDTLASVGEAQHRGRDALRDVLCEVAARLGVYRTYAATPPPRLSGEDAAVIGEAVASATSARPDLDPVLFELLGRLLRLEVDEPAAVELAMRFQQLTPGAMAKGVEDTAFYRHLRLVALNEVGGDPGRFGSSPASFHRHMADAAAGWPAAMLALSTHDTKRSADVRARLALLSGDVDGWDSAVERLVAASQPYRSGVAGPGSSDTYLFFQTLVGAWPIDADRATAYVLKASREAKLRTSWIAPNAAYEEALGRFVRGSMADARFLHIVEEVVASLLDAGRRAAIGQLAVQLAAPGVPDLYQGDELWQLALVDPDNRRPVDHATRRRLLGEVAGLDAAAAWARRDEGIPKLWLVRHVLDLRRRHEAALGPGGAYRALSAAGHLAEAVVAFVRGGDVVAVVPRLVRTIEREGWSDTRLDLPDGRWRNLDGAEHLGTARLTALVSDFPVALLERVA